MKESINLRNKIFGVDIDETLTDLKIEFSKIKDLEETRTLMRNAPVKKGVEVLQKMCIKPYAITGRGSYFYDDTAYWFEKNSVPYKEIITMDRESMTEFDFNEYMKHKISSYIKLEVDYAMDDDVHIINALNEYGIKGVVVKDNFEEAFWELIDEE